VASGGKAVRTISEEFPIQVTAVSYCGITNINNT